MPAAFFSSTDSRACVLVMKVKVRSEYAVMMTGVGRPGSSLLRGGVERLAELHDVQAALAERGTDRRRRIGLAGLDLQLDVTDYFLCHFSAPGASAWSGSTRLHVPAHVLRGLAAAVALNRLQQPQIPLAHPALAQAFSTWPNSSSTGVERPKISTATRRRLFS